MKTQRRIVVVLVLLGSLALVGAVLAAPTATIVDRYVIGGGGGPQEAGIYTLNGTIGQPVVGAIGNTPYELGAGFWGGMGAVAGGANRIYLPLVVRN